MVTGSSEVLWAEKLVMMFMQDIRTRGQSWSDVVHDHLQQDRNGAEPFKVPPFSRHWPFYGVAGRETVEPHDILAFG